MSNLYHDNNITVAELTKKLASKLIDSGLRLTTAESCTGGKLSVALCAEENTADFYDVGLVVFSDSAKERILGVSPDTLARFTAVRPEGGDDGTAAGTVCFAWNINGQTETSRVLFSGDCEDVVEKAVHYSLAELVTKLSG